MIAFRFPYVFLFYVILALVWVLWIIHQRRHKQVFSTSVPALEDSLLSHLDKSRAVWKKRLGLLSLLFLVFAASGPQLGTRLKPVERKGVDLVFAVDVSVSMDARDVKPSRLEKAKFEISQMIRQLKGDRVGLIVFAGTSNLYLPLTTDYEAAQLFLDAIDTRMIPTQGTDLSTALRTAMGAFTAENNKYKVLVLVTDGEDHQGEALKVARDAAAAGIVIHTVGVGTPTGSLIPVKTPDKQGENYKRDHQGKLVTSLLNEDILYEIASSAGGIFVRLDNRYASYKELLGAIDRMEKKTIKTHTYSQYEDRFQLFAGLAVILMLLRFHLPTRRKEAETWRGRFVQD